MFTILLASLDKYSVQGQSRRAALLWLLWFTILVGLAGLLGLAIVRFGPTPNLIAWMIFFLGAIAILYQPRYGIYLSIFFALLGDNLLSPWYPFVKNFSSAESIFYLHNSLIISPFEVYMGLTFLSWLVRAVGKRKFSLYTGPLFVPAMIFAGFIIFGMIYGFSFGGNVVIGLWEARAILYLPVLLVLVSNLITKREHFSHLMWFIMVALFLEGVLGVFTFFIKYQADLTGVDAITEHAAAVQINTLFVYILAVWLYKASPAKRFILPCMAPVVGLVYLATQRRAAFVSLFIALLLIAFVLFIENRRLFWMIVPPAMFVLALYTAAFWNSSSTIGLPARAIKSVVKQDQASEEDQLSNLYRLLENINSNYTIHMTPFTGVGFGQKFHIIITMPDISTFEWWEYITHNSVIWMWMKTGIGGFVTMIYLVGLSVIIGGRALWRMPRGDLSAIALTATLYLVMHFTYAYVDMSWDLQSMAYIGTMMGVINVMEHVVAQPVPRAAKRWPWQPEPEQAPTLKSFPPMKLLPFLFSKEYQRPS